MAEPSDTPDTPETPEPAAPAAPQYVTVDEFRRMEQAIAGQRELIASVNQSLQTLAATRQREAATPASPGEMSDADIDAAVDEGRMTPVQAARLIAKREAARVERDHVAPLRDTGIASMSTFARESALNARDDKGTPRLKYYKQYQKEIDGWIEKLPPQARLDPTIYQQAHDLVVGSHMHEILEAEREAAIRAANQPKPEPTAPRTRTGRTNESGTVPTVEELMGSQAAAALEGKGMNPDQFAKRLGYDSWAKYAELAVKGAA